MIAAALARHALRPEDLRCSEVLEPDISLYLRNGLVIRVEISSLPEVAVLASLPETTDDRRRTTEDRGLATEDWRPRTEDRRPQTEDRDRRRKRARSSPIPDP
jgi:hypothetical protein